MCTSTYKLTFTFLQRRLLDYLLFWGSRQLPPSQVSSPPCNSNESVLGQVSRAEGQEKTQILTWSEQKEAQGHLYSVQQNLPLHKAPWQSPENVKHLSGMRPHHYLISLFIWKITFRINQPQRNPSTAAAKFWLSWQVMRCSGSGLYAQKRGSGGGAKYTLYIHYKHLARTRMNPHLCLLGYTDFHKRTI